MLLDRLEILSNANEVSYFDGLTKNSDTIETLLRKGNKGQLAREPHTCCLCRKKFSVRRHLRVHLGVMHCKTTKMFCDFCPKYYFSKDSLFKHMKLHTKKKLRCKKCDYKTVFKSDMAKHKIVHSKKKIECSICQKPVIALKEHLLTHRPKKSCPKCQKFISIKGLKKHTTRCHQVENLG